MSFFPWRTGAKRTMPQIQHSTAPVDVTPSERLRGVTPGPAVYPADRPLDPELCSPEYIRAHLPNAKPPAPSPSLIAARHARVLDQEAKFLADHTGTVEPPDRDELIESLRFAAEALRDKVVIA